MKCGREKERESGREREKRKEGGPMGSKSKLKPRPGGNNEKQKDSREKDSLRQDAMR